MNDTIMASLAAAKSNQAKPQPKRMTDFRSVRTNAGEKVKGIRSPVEQSAKLPSVSSLTLTLEADLLRQLKAKSTDPVGLAQKIIRDHLRKLEQ